MKQQSLNLSDRNDIHFLYRDIARQTEPKVDHFGRAMQIAKKINRRNRWKSSSEVVREIKAGLAQALRRL
jgi:hypothetical protein